MGRGLSTAVSCGIGHRWHRPAAIVLILPLAWELPYAMGGALKAKKKERERESFCLFFFFFLSEFWIPLVLLEIHEFKCSF